MSEKNKINDLMSVQNNNVVDNKLFNKDFDDETCVVDLNKNCPFDNNPFHENRGGCFLNNNNFHVYNNTSISRESDGSFYFTHINSVRHNYKAEVCLNNIKGRLITSLPNFETIESFLTDTVRFKKLLIILLESGEQIKIKKEKYPMVKNLCDCIIEKSVNNTVFFLRLVLFTQDKKVYYRSWKQSFVHWLKIYCDINNENISKRNNRNRNQCKIGDFTVKKEIVHVNCNIKNSNMCPHLKSFIHNNESFDYSNACEHVRKYMQKNSIPIPGGYECLLYTHSNELVHAFNNIYGRYDKLHAICCCPDICISDLWFKEFKKMLQYLTVD